MLGRCGECLEVARVVIFLSSSSASFITGTDIPIDGGYQQMSGERMGEESSFAGSE
jgi:NAD(P)-dependent dehydrogenase (short-subunit alcohol dehydrogenase family)